MSKIIIGITGKNSSGKTTLTEYLKQKYNATSFRFSDPLSDILKRIYLPTTRPNLQTLSTILRQNFSEDLLSKTISEDAKNATTRVVVCEGVRRPTDITYLKANPGFKLIALSATPENRYSRLKNRGEKPDDATKTWENFSQEENQESETKIDEIAATANFTIDNNSDKENLLRQIDEIIAKLNAN